MMRSPCLDLDAYIGDWLSAAQRARFESHLRGCLACREEMSNQARLDRLLQLARGRLHPAPPALIERISAVLGAPPRRWPASVAASVAAAVALVLGLIVWGALGIPTRAPEPSLAAPGSAAPLPSTGLASVRFDPDSGVVAVPIKTTNPNVSIVFVYPTVGAAEGRIDAPPEPRSLLQE